MEVSYRFEQLIENPEESRENFVRTGPMEKCVLGIDIVGYSKYKPDVQLFIPVAFNLILLATIEDCFRYEVYLFGHTQLDDFEKEITNDFIDCGDGGFLQFETPLHGIAFAIYFECKLREYNTGSLNKSLYDVTGEIVVRYGFAFDKLYKIEYKNGRTNSYGESIIKCARILSKDKLNRCLIDERTYHWFLKNINGFETLRKLNLEDLKQVIGTNGRDLIGLSYKGFDGLRHLSFCFPENRDNPQSKSNGIDRADILKIGEIIAKEKNISVYSIYVQLPYSYTNEPDASRKFHRYTITLGNLNPLGIMG